MISKYFVSLSAKSSLILGKNKAAFCREGHLMVRPVEGYRVDYSARTRLTQSRHPICSHSITWIIYKQRAILVTNTIGLHVLCHRML